MAKQTMQTYKRNRLAEYYTLKKGNSYIEGKMNRRPKFVETERRDYAIKFTTEKEAQKYKEKYKGVGVIDSYEIVKEEQTPIK